MTIILSELKPEQFSDWQPGSSQPIRKGWYQRQFPNGEIAFWYFDGWLWRYGGYAAPMSYIVSRASAKQHFPWRGLAERAE